MRLCALLLVPVLAGCSFHSSKYMKYPQNPYTHVRTIAVAPFLSEGSASGAEASHSHGAMAPATDGNGLEAAEIFANELAQVPGIRVIRPGHVKDAVLKDASQIANVQEALAVAKKLGADAIIVGVVTDYDPYPPPRAGIAIQMFAENPSAENPGGDPTSEVLSGRPLAVGPAEQRFLVIAFERVFDAHQAATRDELRDYAESFTPEDRGFQGEGYFLGVYERYLHFCANVMIREILASSESAFVASK